MKFSNSVFYAAALLLVSGAPATQAAGNPKAGQAIASQCAACHGPKGMATLPSAPNLAGQSLQTASAVVMHAKALNLPAVQVVHGLQALASDTVE